MSTNQIEHSTDFLQEAINFLPHGSSLQIIERVLFYSKNGHILCKAKPHRPKSMIVELADRTSGTSSSAAIEYIAQASAVARIIENRLIDRKFKAFGAIIKVSSLKKLSQNIGLDIPLLIYAEYKNILPYVYEVSGALRNANTNEDFATATFNIIEFDQ